jgi:endonuclease/exonuclease/phosphatase family metal-dependent hydrolase
VSVLRVATYNLHAGIGADRRFRPQRLARVLAEIDADIVALQEVASPERGFDLGAFLARQGGYAHLAGVTFHRPHGPFGNALLTRLPLHAQGVFDLSLPGREPRSAIDATLQHGPQRLRVLATHLGLGPGERAMQARRLLHALEAATEDALLVLGDLNEWLPRAASLRCLAERFALPRALPSFPAPFPSLALDRILAHPAAALRRLWTHRSRAARWASDHLPLVAEIDMAPAVPDAGSPRAKAVAMD